MNSNILLLFVFVATTLAFSSPLQYARNVEVHPLRYKLSEGSAGDAVFVSKYLDQPELARKLSKVGSLCNGECDIDFGYAGFFTVNETYNSNLFYWFFPAMNGDANAPLLIWLQGGPGSSSLFGLFTEVGPFNLTQDLTLEAKPYTWNSKYAMIFIDNPIGTGFSFTDDDAGYSNNEVEIAQNLYNLLTQFYKVYPDYASNDLYLTGESYAGKYIPALGYKILQENQRGYYPKINLQGLSIGDGLCDPVTQVTAYSDYAYAIGIADEHERSEFAKLQSEIVFNIQLEDWNAANNAFNVLINSPFGDTLFTNVSGAVDYYDVRNTVEPFYGYDYVAYVNSSAIRQKLNVGDHYFQETDDVYQHLALDIPQSIKQYIPELLDNYKVMFYNGQWDFIVAAITTERFLYSVPWQHIKEFKQSKKAIWKVTPQDVNVAGYARQYGSLTQLIVHNAGHILPFNQPRAAFDLIDRFIQNVPFDQ